MIGLAIMPVMTNVSGILSNKPEGKGLRWLVNKRQSIDILAQINGEAAKWLLQNIGLEGSFTFRIDEAAVVE